MFLSFFKFYDLATIAKNFNFINNTPNHRYYVELHTTFTHWAGIAQAGGAFFTVHVVALSAAQYRVPAYFETDGARIFILVAFFYTLHVFLQAVKVSLNLHRLYRQRHRRHLEFFRLISRMLWHRCAIVDCWWQKTWRGWNISDTTRCRCSR